MEACGSAHHFGRWLQSLGHRVALLPPQYVRPYLRAATKTDAADCAALLQYADHAMALLRRSVTGG